MCDRKDAIRYIITNHFGSKKELESHIHEHYNTFVVTGFIYEPPEAPDFGDDSTSAIHPEQIHEWIATPEAYKRAKLLKIKAQKDFRFNSTRERSILRLLGRISNVSNI